MKQPWRMFGIVGLAATICLATVLGPRAPAAQAQASCVELVQNGGFEDDAAWLLGPAPQIPEYVTYTHHSGARALALGITKGPSQKSYSSARQTVTIPPHVASVTLSFWFNAMLAGPVHGQYMELALLAPDGAVLDKLWHTQNDSRIWNQLQFDMARWRGRTVQIYFNVYNDGQGGTAGMFLDDVTLVACSTGTPAPTATASRTPTPTRTPTAGLPVWTMTYTPHYVTPTPGPLVATSTPTPYYWTPSPQPPSPTPPVITVLPPPMTPPPDDCVDLARNGGFDAGWTGWYPSVNVLPAQLVGSPTLSPPYALQLGSQSQQARSYSSVRQYLNLPSGSRLTLQFSTWTWTEPNAGADRQEAILLAADNSVLAVLWRVLANEQGWRQVAVDLTPYGGRQAAIYFNVANDGAGGRTALFLDNVKVRACPWSGSPAAPVTVLPPIGLTTPTRPASPTAPSPAGPVTVLPPITLVAPAALPELDEAAVGRRAGVNPEPVMTRIALEGPPAASPTARATVGATPTPSPTPTMLPPGRAFLEELTAQASVAGCVAGLALVVSIFVLLIFGVIIPWLKNRPAGP